VGTGHRPDHPTACRKVADCALTKPEEGGGAGGDAHPRPSMYADELDAYFFTGVVGLGAAGVLESTFSSNA
jgi:hypothetical protein